MNDFIINIHRPLSPFIWSFINTMPITVKSEKHANWQNGKQTKVNMFKILNYYDANALIFALEY